eukprot:TRINITY_DN5189_c0_g1_i1.p1 TRINITY_DN5189_c0_g1~~TRINITY_DN5189_c0_g1_i1.p1  ORF type:complete len:504 (-),score=113.14 TRINITY_DN5189_c0_g1_i1:57-1535(-)
MNSKNKPTNKQATDDLTSSKHHHSTTSDKVSIKDLIFGGAKATVDAAKTGVTSQHHDSGHSMHDQHKGMSTEHHQYYDENSKEFHVDQGHAFHKGTHQYPRGDGAVVVEHVHGTKHDVERHPVTEDIAKDIIITRNVIPEEVTEVHRHIHPVERRVIKEHVHPKEVTEVIERVHEYKTKEVHEHLHPLMEKEVRKDVYLPEQRHIEHRSVDHGEVSRSIARDIPRGGIPSNAKVVEHVHHMKTNEETVPVMENTERRIETRREVIPEERTEIHRHIHPVEKEIITEHIHPKEVTEIVEDIHELKTTEFHDHVHPVEIKEIRKDIYLPEKRIVQEKYIDLGEVSRERVDVDYGVQKVDYSHETGRGVTGEHTHLHHPGEQCFMTKDAYVSKDLHTDKHPHKHKKDKHVSHPKGDHHKKEGNKKLDIDLEFDVSKSGKVTNTQVKTTGKGKPTKVDVEVDVKDKKGIHHDKKTIKSDDHHTFAPELAEKYTGHS